MTPVEINATRETVCSVKIEYKTAVFPPTFTSQQGASIPHPLCELRTHSKHDAMNKIIYLAALGLLAPTPIAAGVPFRRANTTKQCVQLEVPIPVIATNDHYIMPRVDSNIDAIDWTVNVSTWSTASATARITGQVPVDSTFSIYAQLCVPSQNGIKADILQIATAGNGFDSQSVMLFANRDKGANTD